MVERLFLAVSRGCLQFVIVVFPDHTHLLFKSIGTASANSANSVESDLGCTSRIYFDNVGDNVTLTLYNATLTSQKP